ncbi:hypothetical protein GIB67_008748 [Kingdonia uniflora]|uniref:Aminotransferase-like plant mobile domain-containing protein n=1 Tax=Kingdonia uniflora TaxID=39325 RepID=A0A7J7P5U7_9MAGN|nr:hypothetical protein GIB67_008748 [Kingdonia uniflora]
MDFDYTINGTPEQDEDLEIQTNNVEGFNDSQGEFGEDYSTDDERDTNEVLDNNNVQFEPFMNNHVDEQGAIRSDEEGRTRLLQLQDVWRVIELRVEGDVPIVQGWRAGNITFTCEAKLKGKNTMNNKETDVGESSSTSEPVIFSSREVAKAYMLYILRFFLFPTKNGTNVSTKYLYFFENKNSNITWSWGIAALVHLYYSLGAALRIHGKAFACCTTLLEFWIFEHFPELPGIPKPKHFDAPEYCTRAYLLASAFANNNFNCGQVQLSWLPKTLHALHVLFLFSTAISIMPFHLSPFLRSSFARPLVCTTRGYKMRVGDITISTNGVDIAGSDPSILVRDASYTSRCDSSSSSHKIAYLKFALVFDALSNRQSRCLVFGKTWKKIQMLATLIEGLVGNRAGINRVKLYTIVHFRGDIARLKIGSIVTYVGGSTKLTSLRAHSSYEDFVTFLEETNEIRREDCRGLSTTKAGGSLRHNLFPDPKPEYKGYPKTNGRGLDPRRFEPFVDDENDSFETIHIDVSPSNEPSIPQSNIHLSNEPVLTNVAQSNEHFPTIPTNVPFSNEPYIPQSSIHLSNEHVSTNVPPSNEPMLTNVPLLIEPEPIIGQTETLAEFRFEPQPEQEKDLLDFRFKSVVYTEDPDDFSKEFNIGNLYRDKIKLKNHIRAYAVVNKFNLEHVLSNEYKIVVLCKGHKCSWRIYVTRLVSSVIFRVSTYCSMHTCIRVETEDARQLSARIPTTYELLYRNSETTESWTYFLEMFGSNFRCYGTRFVVISDRNPIIKNVVPKVFPFAIHTFCAFYISNNIKTTLENMRIAFGMVAEALTNIDFDKHMNVIQNIDPVGLQYILDTKSLIQIMLRVRITLFLKMGIPCEHGVRALGLANVDPATRVSEYYTNNVYKAVYEPIWIPIRGIEQWKILKTDLRVRAPIPTVQAGRPRTQRKRREKMPGLATKLRFCSKCRKKVQNRRSCKYLPIPSDNNIRPTMAPSFTMSTEPPVIPDEDVAISLH